jgi:hypothetical protein
MYLSNRTTLLAVLLLSPLPSLRAQAAADPSGHWEGAVHAPFGELGMEVDLAKNSKGELAGTYTNLAGNLKGFPLASVAVEGKSVRFVLKAGSGGGTFDGVLSAEAKSISGDFLIGGNYVPFSLSRTGDARIEAAPKSPAIGKEMEGVWNGTLDTDGTNMRLELMMSNQPDGTATGSVDVDGGLTIPITAITQKASDLTFELKSVGASYSGVLNAERTALAGAYTEGTFTAPLTFQRAAATKDNKK